MCHECIPTHIVKPTLVGPLSDEARDRLTIGPGAQGLAKLLARLETEVEPGVGERRPSKRLGELIEPFTGHRGAGDEVGDVRGAHLVDGLTYLLHVLDHAEVATGLQEVGAGGDRLHPAGEQIGDVEGVCAPGEGEQQVATELLVQQVGQVRGHRMQRTPR